MQLKKHYMKKSVLLGQFSKQTKRPQGGVSFIMTRLEDDYSQPVFFRKWR